MHRHVDTLVQRALEVGSGKGIVHHHFLPPPRAMRLTAAMSMISRLGLTGSQSKRPGSSHYGCGQDPRVGEVSQPGADAALGRMLRIKFQARAVQHAVGYYLIPGLEQRKQHRTDDRHPRGKGHGVGAATPAPPCAAPATEGWDYCPGNIRNRRSQGKGGVGLVQGCERKKQQS